MTPALERRPPNTIGLRGRGPSLAAGLAAAVHSFVALVMTDMLAIDVLLCEYKARGVEFLVTRYIVLVMFFVTD